MCSVLCCLFLFALLQTVCCASNSRTNRRHHHPLRLRHRGHINNNKGIRNDGPIHDEVSPKFQQGDDNNEEDEEDDNELGNGTGAGFVRGVGTVTQSTCPICVCYHPCNIRINNIIIGDNVKPETIDAVLNAVMADEDTTTASDGQEQSEGPAFFETLLGAADNGQQQQATQDRDNNAAFNPVDGITEEGGTATATNSCEQECNIQCENSNCGPDGN